MSLTSRLPRIVIFNGNGSIHTAVEGFKDNASAWGYEVYTTTILEPAVLNSAEMLILNAQNFYTEDESTLIKSWWNSTDATIWFVGDSDYGGIYIPSAMNNLSVQLGLHIILQDDAMEDPINNDRAVYRILANETNPNWTEFDLTGIYNGSFHGPCPVVPYNGTTDGINDMPSWDDLPYADWIWNTSRFGKVLDQDFDGDNKWEYIPPFTNGSFPLLAAEWHTGPNNKSKAIFSGEAIFADYKNMFSYISVTGLTQLSTITLIQRMITWAVDNTPIDVELIPRNYIITVWNGNGADHTSIEGFKTNATEWGYFVHDITTLTHDSLVMTDILLLNAQKTISEEEKGYIIKWWNSGDHAIWFTGDSDYGGIYIPSAMNNLSVELGLHIILQDDAIEDPIHNDDASYRVIANETNPSWTQFDLTGIYNGSFHAPCPVVPYNGTTDGINGMPSWDDLPYADWIWNTSRFGKVLDQDFDGDNTWEFIPPLTNGSISLLAAEWHTGPNNKSKAIFSGEAIFSDYKNMFGKVSANGFAQLTTITLIERMFKWIVDPSGFTGRGPNIVVFNGNEAYHTAIEGFTANASAWGYNVIATNYLNGIILEVTDILILNAPKYLTESERTLIKMWWHSGDHAIWFAGDSDYDALYNPFDMNILAVELGLHIILQDDCLMDNCSNDGAIHRIIANTTNPDWTAFDISEVKYGLFHAPCPVVPYNGTTDGINDMPNWEDLPYTDWIWNTSGSGTIMDQDHDADNVWEGYPPLVGGSYTLLAAEWHTGPNGMSKAIFSGEAIFADYKNMFGKVTENFRVDLQTITLVNNMLNWTHPSANRYFDEVWVDDIYPPEIVSIHHNLYDGTHLYNNQDLHLTFSVLDWGQSLLELESVEVFYSVDSTPEVSAAVTQIGYSDFESIIGPFAIGSLVKFYIKVVDKAGFTYTSMTYFFTILSDSTAPNIMNVWITPTANIDPTTIVIVSTDVEDVDSGLLRVETHYSTDFGNSWIVSKMNFITDNNFALDLPTFEEGTTVIVKVYAEDMVGNSAFSSELSFTSEYIVTTTTTISTTTPPTTTVPPTTTTSVPPTTTSVPPTTTSVPPTTTSVPPTTPTTSQPAKTKTTETTTTGTDTSESVPEVSPGFMIIPLLSAAILITLRRHQR
ncbi:MAG: hypothetical protein ACFFB5_10060 [Promethearchaeota archaeon]